jgi:hypothetical protein
MKIHPHMLRHVGEGCGWARHTNSIGSQNDTPDATPEHIS